MARYRVYADFNGLQHSPRTAGRLALYLHYWGSLKDISRHKVRLVVGMELDVYSDSDEEEDLEATGTVYFDDSSRQWFVEFERAGIRDVPTRRESFEQPLVCWNCGSDLSGFVSTRGLNVGDRCPACNERIHQPLDPPP